MEFWEFPDKFLEFWEFHRNQWGNGKYCKTGPIELVQTSSGPVQHSHNILLLCIFNLHKKSRKLTKNWVRYHQNWILMKFWQKLWLSLLISHPFLGNFFWMATLFSYSMPLICTKHQTNQLRIEWDIIKTKFWLNIDSCNCATWF